MVCPGSTPPWSPCACVAMWSLRPGAAASPHSESSSFLLPARGSARFSAAPQRPRIPTEYTSGYKPRAGGASLSGLRAPGSHCLNNPLPCGLQRGWTGAGGASRKHSLDQHPTCPSAPSCMGTKAQDDPDPQVVKCQEQIGLSSKGARRSPGMSVTPLPSTVAVGAYVTCSLPDYTLQQPTVEGRACAFPMLATCSA